MIKRLFIVLIRIIELQLEILAELRNRQSSQPISAEDPTVSINLIDTADTKSLLKISDSTLYRLKKDKIITAIQIGKRDYYSMAEIQVIAKRFFK